MTELPIMQHLYCIECGNKISSSAKQYSKCGYKKKNSALIGVYTFCN